MDTLLPRVLKYGRTPIFPEVALPTLDVGFGCSLYNQAITLPAPHVDIDPAFMFSVTTPEVNTSRRSDHDARYKVT